MHVTSASLRAALPSLRSPSFSARLQESLPRGAAPSSVPDKLPALLSLPRLQPWKKKKNSSKTEICHLMVQDPALSAGKASLALRQRPNPTRQGWRLAPGWLSGRLLSLRAPTRGRPRVVSGRVRAGSLLSLAAMLARPRHCSNAWGRPWPRWDLWDAGLTPPPPEPPGLRRPSWKQTRLQVSGTGLEKKKITATSEKSPFP